MKQSEKTKLAKLVGKFTQKEAVFDFLSDGHVLSITDARAAGIADPRRVVNKIRNLGHGIQEVRSGSARAFRLNPAELV